MTGKTGQSDRLVRKCSVVQNPNTGVVTVFFTQVVQIVAIFDDLYFRLAPDGQIDLLIVVDQMLTGFDSKWINTLYLDKLMKFESIIQAFSRTNRLFGPEKPFGTIRYYRSPHTMARNIEEAVKLYSGNKPLALFADKLEFNLQKMNSVYAEISHLFRSAGVPDFEKLPDNKAERGVLPDCSRI